MKTLLFYLLVLNIAVLAADFEIQSPYSVKKQKIKFSPHNHTKTSEKDTHANRYPWIRMSELRDQGGFKAVAITDHNRITIPENTPRNGTKEWNEQNVLFVPGIELSNFKWSSWNFYGELNCTGVSTEHTDPHKIRTFKHNRWNAKTHPETVLADLVNEGAFVILCHPNANEHTRGWKATGYTYDELDRIFGNPEKGLKPFPVLPYGMEIGNQNYDLHYRGNFRNAEAKWDHYLTRGFKLWGTASDDSHNEPCMAGWCSVYLNELTLKELMENLKNGNFYATQGPEFKQIKVNDTEFSVETFKPCRIEFIGAGGNVLKEARHVTTLSYHFSGFEKYVRCRISRHCPEVRASYSGYINMRSAWTQPVFISRKKTEQSLILFENGKSDFQIETASKNPLDIFAAKELADALKKMTKIDFVHTKGSKKIVIGTPPKGVQWDLSDQASVIQPYNGNLYLYGTGKYGAVYAVYDLLEKQFGCKWLSAWGYSYYPNQKILTVKPEVMVNRPAFKIRSNLIFFFADKAEASLFAFRNRQNNELRNKNFTNYYDSVKTRDHSFSFIMPPGNLANIPKCFNTKFPHGFMPENSEYFKTHPEFFSMDEKGKRVPNRQLCFSNPELRKEFTKNVVLLHDSQTKHFKKDIILSISQNDVMQNFCLCSACRTLQKKYKTPGGAFFDYLYELCTKYPQYTFLTLAYQRTQTQHPPLTMKKMPDNLIILYCPIGGDYAANLMGKNNREEMQDMYNWALLSDNVWVWYYPNPYQNKLLKDRFLIPPPVGNLERLADDIRLMRKFGIAGTNVEHDSNGAQIGANFTELQTWLMLKLYENPEREVADLIKEFTDPFYGAASKIMRDFLHELETERKKIVKSGGRWWMYDGHYAYLTAKNMTRWSRMFDEAEKITSGEQNFHVRLARLGLDSAIVELMDEKDPVRTGAPQRLKRTLEDVKNKRRKTEEAKKLSSWLDSKKGSRINKNLPGHLSKLAPSNIQILKPAINDSNKKYYIADDASFLGKSVQEEGAGKVCTLSVTDPENPKNNVKLTIKKDKMYMDGFHFYRFPKTIHLNSATVLTSPGGKIRYNLGAVTSHDDAAGAQSEWNVHISLRFVTDKKNKFKVYSDRLVLVRKK